MRSSSRRCVACSADMIGRLCVVGLGLIGGSAARAARLHGLSTEIVGVDPDPGNLARALELGVIDSGSRDLADYATEADLVLLAVPVGAFARVFDELRGRWSAAAVYTDAASTKCSVIEDLRRSHGLIPRNFVPGHPIAGAEQSGVDAANPKLYEGRRVILTPGPECDPRALDTVRTFWTGIGARVALMQPDQHDAVLAATSHLPHVLAYTLTHLLGAKDEQQEIFQYAAGGLRDFSRIASSDPTMWRDICLANRANILPLIDEFRAELDRFADFLRDGSAEQTFEFLAVSRAARQRFLARMDD